MEKLLITGVDGTVGANLALGLAERCEVVGLYRRLRVELPDCRTLPCDHASPDDLSAAVRSEAPSCVVHCGPLAEASWDATDAARLTAEQAAVEALAAAAAACQARFVLLSTDAVFAGPRMFHEETFPRAMACPYSSLAAQIEDALAGTPALIVRTHAFGHGPGGEGFAERTWAALMEGRPLAADARRHATPLLASDLAELLWRACQRRLTGVCHLGGAERTSPARFAQEMATMLGVRVEWSGAAAEGDQTLPLLETSLNTRHARRELGLPLPMLREGLGRFVEQAANGHRDRLKECRREALCAAA